MFEYLKNMAGFKWGLFFILFHDIRYIESKNFITIYESKSIWFRFRFWIPFVYIKLIFTFQTSKPQHTCYELIEEYEGFRDNAKYGLEGVGILVVGSIGLLGNVLSVFIFKRSRGNKGFHRLLIM